MLNNGDKLIVVKTVADFLKEGDVAEVVNVNENGVISFAFGENNEHMGLMTQSEFEEHFKKFEDVMVAPSVTEGCVVEIMESSEFEVFTSFDKCTIVSCRLPNGFVITEYSACVSPEDYSEEVGANICFDKIADKIWELEAYRLQQNIWESENACCCDGCYGCPCEEEFDECLDTDLDCDDCEDFDCPYNSNINN